MGNIYELRIEDSSGVWRVADFGSDVPAINISRNNFGDLKSRNADSTQELRLPLSQTNKNIFGYSDTFEVVTNLRHKVFNCRLYCNDRTLFGLGSTLRFVSIGNTFNVQLLSSAKTFFNSISENEKTLNDLDFPDTIVRGQSGIDASNPNNFPDANVFFGIADFDTNPRGENSFMKTPNVVWKLFGQFPFVRYKYIIDEIVKQNGYTLETNIANDNEFKNAVIPFQSMYNGEGLNAPKEFARGDKSTNATSIATNTSFSEFGGSNGMPMAILGNGFETGLSEIYSDTETFGDRMMNTITFTAFASGAYTFGYDIRLPIIEDDTPCFIFFYKGDVQIHQIFATRNSQSENLEFGGTFDVELMIGDKIHIEVVQRKPLYGQIGSVVCDFILWDILIFTPESDKKEPLYNFPIPLKGNLPQTKQYDFFKTFLQVYGLIVDIDEERKVVKAYSQNKVIEQKQNAKDWSAKMQRNSGLMKFVLENYAQRNWIKYQPKEISIKRDERYAPISEGIALYLHSTVSVYYSESDTSETKIIIEPAQAFVYGQFAYFIFTDEINKIEYKDEAFISANDESISKESEFINLDFEACNYNPLGSNFYAKIPRYTKAEAHEYDYEDENKLLLANNTINRYTSIELTQNLGGKATVLRYVSPFLNAQNSVKADNLSQKYYGVLQNNILLDMRVVEDVEFYLTEKDIEDYDPFTPIYIDYFGAYFYVNKIKNFQYGRLTKCDIVKI